VSLARALELAASAAGTAYPKPTVGAVVVSADGTVVGEGVTEAGGRHAEVVALDAAGTWALGATLYATLEPCAHYGTTPPCSERILRDGVARVVVGARDPNPEAGGGVELLRAGGVEVDVVDSAEARAQNEAWRVWVAEHRPFVTYKVAATLDGAVVVGARRYLSGEASLRLVHELRAASDAVAVGMGTVRADAPRLDARGVDTPRGQPRRLAFGRGPLPDGSTLELRSGKLADELRALADEGVQSLLLEGGPTLATAFLAADLIDKVLVFTVPLLAGAEEPQMLARLGSARALTRLTARPVGEDVLLEAYVHPP
jgi:diaminohydroxyphosphoribosylaminopyrimidine deaminase / 5-amino-6-(5-phosphoribosylamino)uracil reductase